MGTHTPPTSTLHRKVADSWGPPPPNNTVRAKLQSGGGVIKPSSDGGCDVVFMTQVDFVGALPQSVVTMVSRTSPLALASARKILREAGEAAAAAAAAPEGSLEAK